MIKLSERENKTVYRDGNRIIKEGPADIISDEFYWYQTISKTTILIPKIYDITDNIIVLEYVEQNSKIDICSIKELKKYISIMSKLPAPKRNFEEFAHFRNKELLKEKKIFENYYSLIHGNFELRNIIFNENGPYLIDPLIRSKYKGPPMFNSYLVDYGSLYFSIDNYFKETLKNDYHNLVEILYKKTNIFSN